jgi:hypothetical protein
VLRTVNAAKRVARFKKETFVSFVMRSLEREVLRFQAELAHGPVEARISFDDLAEREVLALLTEREKRDFGLL